LNPQDNFVHVTPSVSRLAGGLFESVRHLSHSVHAASRVPVTVLGLQDQRTSEDSHQWTPLPVRTQPVLGPRNFGYSPQLVRDLFTSRPSLVHLHGLWRYTSFAVWRWSVRTGRPYIVSPHGMLEPWALRQSSWKKRCALLLYTGACLRRAACLRATSNAEALNIRHAGFTNPIAIVPNGVRCPRELPPPVEKAEVRNGRVLFLSRIHPKKGLLNLIQAWAVLRPANWELSIVGPDECGHLAKVRALVHALGLEDKVHFLGELWGEAKTDLFLGSDLFVLPSFSENFGLVVAEALASGVPVITTRATPWKELEDRRCGWWIEIGVQPLVDALRAALATPRGELREMGKRGHELVKRNYCWERIGTKMVEVYEWMLSRRDKPGCVDSER
jgi:glycosyltransferase involved in cell wall biosynthesis